MDTIRLLLRDHIDGLTPERERALLEQAQREPGSEGSREAENLLVRHFLALIVTMARRRVRSRPKLSQEDLTAAGLDGLLHAIRMFDLSRSTRLSTYASHWISQRMDRWEEDHGNGQRPRIPTYLYRLYGRAVAIPEASRARNEDELMRIWEAHGLGDHAHLLLAVYRNQCHPVRSLSRDDDGHQGTVIPAPAIDDREEEIIEQRSFAARAIRLLEPRERAILEYYFRLDEDGGPTRTLQETGDHFGVCRERIRQVVKVALDKMRRWARKEGFRCSSPPEKPANSSRSTCRTAV